MQVIVIGFVPAVSVSSEINVQFTFVKSISQLRFDYDTTTIRLRRKTDMFIFGWHRMEAGARGAS